MASPGSYSFSVNVALQNPTTPPNQYKFQFQYANSVTQNDIGAASQVAEVPTNVVDIDLGNVQVNGFLFMQNLDNTNYIDWGTNNAGDFVPLGRLKAGEIALLRIQPDSVTIGVRAHTANCQLFYCLQED